MNLLEKNLVSLAKNNRELAEKINRHIVDNIPQLVNENGFYNLAYKNTYLHNRQNPLAEAKEIFSMAANTPVSIHIIYGLGLGYLFQVASANSSGTVILYEPDLNIIKTAFSLVDFSNDILKNNVFITDNIEKAGEYIYQKSNVKNTPLMLTTAAYREMAPEKFNEMVEKLQRLVGSYSLDLKYTQQKFYPITRTIIQNIPNLIKEPPLSSIKDFYKGQTAVVVSAGPTLDRDIETIKKYRDNIVLIVVGTAMKTIAKHGITPDFLCIIETFDSSKQLEGLDLSQVNFVTEPYSNINLRKFKFKQIYSHISDNMPVNSFWSKIINEKTDEYLSKGTVSYTALNVARILGCSKIVMVGQDLAYIDGQCYSKDSAYKDLECRFNKEGNKWEITAKDFDNFVRSLSNYPDEETRIKAAKTRLKNLNNSLYYVKSIKGEQIPTESVYAAFIRPLSEFAQRFSDRKFINTSLVGAQIDGYENIQLEEALKDTKPIQNRELNCDYKFDINDIEEKLKLETSLLNKILNEVKNGQSAVKSLNNDFKRYKNATVEVLKDLKKVSSIFLQLSTSNSNTLYDFITAKERIDLDYTMKMSRSFDTKNMSTLITKFNEYFDNSEKAVKVVNAYINKAIGEIK